MITVYDEDDRFEEKAREPEGYFVSYKGFSTHIHWSEIGNVYYGKIEGINEDIYYKREADDLHGQMLQFAVSNMFVKAVNEYIENHSKAN